MPNRQTRRAAQHGKQPPDESPKAHVDHPPLDLEPTEDRAEHPRGEVGQFTGEGSPGLMKK